MNRAGQYEYRINSGVLSPSQVPKLQQKLDDLLPYSLPVTRRIEYHLSHPISPTARIFVAAAADVAVAGSTDGDGHGHGHGEKTDVPYDNGEDDAQSDRPLHLPLPLPSTWTRSGHHPDDDDEHWLDSWLLTTTTSSSSPSSEASNHRPWLAAHIDLLNSGQTQVWLFASWEAPSPSLSCNNDDTDTDTDHLTTGGGSAFRGDVSVHKNLMHELFTYIYTVLVPAMPLEPSDEWLQLKRTGKTLTTPYSRNKVLFGTVGEKLWHLFPQEARARTDPGYLKYVFSPEEEEDEGKSGATTADNNNTNNTSLLLLLPPGYKFGEMRPSDLQTVLDRSTIPRTLSTLRQYVSVGIFSSSSSSDANDANPNIRGPVAWGFLGKDASISSLHTEPAHRGKGLAVCLACELLHRQRQRQRQSRAASPFPEDTSTLKRGTGMEMGCWAHADVSQDNIPSRRVMEKLGGKPMWMVMWTELDLEKVMSVE
jgi:ribosomal protein S18 acetylase RimI-like enzyme